MKFFWNFFYEIKVFCYLLYKVQLPRTIHECSGEMTFKRRQLRLQRDIGQKDCLNCKSVLFCNKRTHRCCIEIRQTCGVHMEHKLKANFAQPTPLVHCNSEVRECGECGSVAEAEASARREDPRASGAATRAPTSARPRAGHDTYHLCLISSIEILPLYFSYRNPKLFICNTT